MTTEDENLSLKLALIVAREQLEKTRTALEQERTFRADDTAQLRADLSAANQKFKDLNKELGCELMDPCGTIWEHAAKVEKDLAAARAELEEFRGSFQKEYLRGIKLQAEVERLTSALTYSKSALKEVVDYGSCDCGPNEGDCVYCQCENALDIIDKALAGKESIDPIPTP